MENIQLANIKIDILKKFNILKWCGAISFEERCMNSLFLLYKQRVKIKQGLLIDYPKKSSSYLIDIEKRNKHRAKMESYLSNLSAEIVKEEIHPYRFSYLHNILLKYKMNDEFMVDISCLTKIHTISLAYHILKSFKNNLLKIIGPVLRLCILL